MTYVALLRGINVGGNNKVDMKQLEATFERAGLREVRTYINSGNVIFSSAARRPAQLRRTLESAIESEFGFAVPTLLRNAPQVQSVVVALPETWANDAAAKTDVIFLSEEIDSRAILEELTIVPGIDDVRYVPGAILRHVERSKAARSGLLKLVGTPLYAQMTVRNCNTVRKIAALMR
jgi:uncharacterized protein (DUF1697 family)